MSEHMRIGGRPRRPYEEVLAKVLWRLAAARGRGDVLRYLRWAETLALISPHRVRAAVLPRLREVRRRLLEAERAALRAPDEQRRRALRMQAAREAELALDDAVGDLVDKLCRAGLLRAGWLIEYVGGEAPSAAEELAALGGEDGRADEAG